MTPDDLEYQGTDSWDRLTWKHKQSGLFYCTVDLKSDLNAVLAGEAQLYVKCGDIDGEPNYPVKLSPTASAT